MINNSDSKWSIIGGAFEKVLYTWGAKKKKKEYLPEKNFPIYFAALWNSYNRERRSTFPIKLILGNAILKKKIFIMTFFLK